MILTGGSGCRSAVDLGGACGRGGVGSSPARGGVCGGLDVLTQANY